MNTIPVIAFSAWSGTGKTTLIEKLIRELKGRGLRIAVIKHDGHSFDIDHEGKDSWRFTKAGADITMISSAEKTAITFTEFLIGIKNTEKNCPKISVVFTKCRAEKKDIGTKLLLNSVQTDTA